MKVAGLFAGIGGFELGLERSGFATSILCEIDPRARAILSSRFPQARICADVRALDRLPRDIALITAGFPCQDLSQAGSTAGIDGARSGLVREVFRLVEQRPVPWILLENVPFLLRLNGGRGIEYVVRRLERLGYTWAYRVFDTLTFGLPQRRKRVFLLASREGDPGGVLFGVSTASNQRSTTKPTTFGFYWTEGNRGLGWTPDAIPAIKGGSALGIPSAPAIWFPDGRFATPDIRDAERLQGFPSNWSAPARSVGRDSYRWTLIGNAVSVPISAWIGRRLSQPSHRFSKCVARELDEGEPWPTAAYGSASSGRYAIELDGAPSEHHPRRIEQFLRFDPKPLSHRAASGFFDRLTRSTLKRPRAFDRSLAKYIQSVRP